MPPGSDVWKGSLKVFHSSLRAGKCKYAHIWPPDTHTQATLLILTRKCFPHVEFCHFWSSPSTFHELESEWNVMLKTSNNNFRRPLRFKATVWEFITKGLQGVVLSNNSICFKLNLWFSPRELFALNYEVRFCCGFIYGLKQACFALCCLLQWSQESSRKAQKMAINLFFHTRLAMQMLNVVARSLSSQFYKYRCYRRKAKSRLFLKDCLMSTCVTARMES